MSEILFGQNYGAFALGHADHAAQNQNDLYIITLSAAPRKRHLTGFCKYVFKTGVF